MGMDLRLYVISRFDTESSFPRHLTDTVLDVPRNSELFAQIRSLPSVRQLEGSCFFASSWETHHHDGYGNDLTSVTAGDLATLRESSELYFNPWLRAVFAYLRELPADTRVVLYWH